MKKYIFLFILTAACSQLFAQRLENDIFGDPTYLSQDLQYQASLKKDIFSNLTFSDNKGNEVKFEKKYLDAFYPNLLENSEAKFDFFRYQISKYSNERNYKATYSVDIFDKVIISDNRGRELVIGKDIFGNRTYDETKENGVKTSIRRDIFGNLEYKTDRIQATIKKDIFGKWMYEDNTGNKLEFSDSTWRMMQHRFENDEDILLYLLNEFVLGRDRN
jgi:lipid II isoglutaminyl synthase (glutamine-hydrolysing)